MNPKDPLALAERADELANRCPPGPYEIWDGCGWRRIGRKGFQGERPVMEPTKHWRDGLPDIEAAQGVLELFTESRTLVPAIAAAVRELVAENERLNKHIESCAAIDVPGSLLPATPGREGVMFLDAEREKEYDERERRKIFKQIASARQ